MALLNSWGLLQSFCLLLGPLQRLRMFQTFSLPLFPRASLPSYLKSAYSSGRLLLESSLPYASIRGDWVSQMHCLTMPSPAPIRGGGGGRLQSCAPQNKGGRSPVIGESWTSMPASICHDSLSLNLQSVKSLLPSWRLQEIWRAKQIWQQALSLWGGQRKALSTC